MRSLNQAEVSTVAGGAPNLVAALLGTVVGSVEALLPIKLQLGGAASVGVNAELHHGVAAGIDLGLKL